MVETWEHLHNAPMFSHLRRNPMDALDVEMSIAEGEQALQALLQFAQEQAGTLEAHEAEKGIFKRLLPIGLAAMKLYFAQRGTGEVGPAVTRADGMILPREKPLRGRDYFSLFGKFAVARTCYRTPGEPGIFPLDAQVNLPERCYSYFLQEWMTLFEVEHPFKESSGWFEQLFDLEVAESVLMEVAKEAPQDYESFYAQRPLPPEATEGELLVVSFDGKGVPMIKAEAERRDPQHRKPLVVLLDGALGLWRLATKLFKPWKRVTFVLDIMHVVGYLWSAANALFGEASQAGKHWVQQKLTEMLRGRVGYVIGGLRQILTKQQLRKSVRETLGKVITFFHNHRRWMQYDVYLAAGLPVGTGVVESACGSVVKHRMEGEGKRWSLEGAEAMLTLRSLKKSHDNDLRDYWRFRAGQERVRLYTSKPKYRPTARLRCVA